MSTLALALLLAAPALAQDADRAAIEAANAEFMRAFAAGDAAGVAALYTPDAVLYAPNAPDMTGREAIRAYFQGAADAGLTRIDLRTDEVLVLGDRAQEYGHFTLFAGDAPVDEGRYTVTWVHDGEGWRLYRDVFNSSRPAPAAAVRAAQDEPVGIALWPVKADQREAFEAFVTDVLWPAAREVEPEGIVSARFLTPTSAEPDGTWTFGFVFDPYVSGADYGVESLVTKALGAEAARAHMERVGAMLAGPVQYVLLTQTL